MTARDVNEFIDGLEHEAELEGTITFGQFLGASQVTYPVDAQNSRFNYLEVNPATGEAEMRYHLEFATPAGRYFYLDGIKYMQRDPHREGARCGGCASGLHHALCTYL